MAKETTTKKSKKAAARKAGAERTQGKSAVRSEGPPRLWPEVWEPRHTWIALGIILFAATALGVICVALFSNSPFFNLPIIDEEAYVRWADEIVAGDWIGHKVFYQDPLYPYFLAVIFEVFGRSFLLVRLLQVVMGTLSVAVVFLMARKLLADQPALLAAGIMALYQGLYFFELQILKETMIILISGASCLLGVMAADQPNRKRTWLVLGISLGLLTLLRGNFQALLPFLVVWAVFAEKGATVPHRLLRAALLLLGLALIIVPVTVRNYKIGGEFVLTTSQGGANFYLGNNELANGRYVTLPFVRANPEWEAGDFKKEAEKRAGHQLTPSQVSSFWFHESWEWWKAHPDRAVKLLFHKARLMIHQHEIPDNHSLYLTRQVFVPALYLALLGFGLLWGPAALGIAVSRRERKTWYPALFAVLYALSIIPFFIVDRYRLAVVPAMAVFAAACLVWLNRKWKAQDTRALWMAAGAILAALALGLLPNSESRAPMGMEYYLLGNAYLKTDHPREAIPWYDQAVKTLPENKDVVRNREEAMLRINSGDVGYLMKEAMKPGKTAEEIVQLGQKLEALGQFRSAVDCYEAATLKDPKFFPAHARLGYLYTTNPELKNPQLAIAHLNQAIEIKPGDLDTINALGNTYFLSGDTLQARAWWQKALAINPNYKSAQQNLDVLDKKPRQK